MAQGMHELTIGDIRCFAINDGAGANLDFEGATQSFPNTNRDEVKAAFDSLSDQQRQFSYNILCLEVDDQNILFDSGFGPPSHDGIGYSVERLQELGISPQDIDIIVITHAHPDHINGLSDADDNAIFPNARYIISKVEWEFWMGNPEGVPAEHVENIQNKLSIIKDNFSVVEPGEEVVQGVTVLEAYGHTPGHITAMIESNNERLLLIVDIAHNQLEAMHPEWDFRLDFYHDIANATRRHIMQRAVDENLLCYSYHFAFPGLGHFETAGAGFVWTPVG